MTITERVRDHICREFAPEVSPDVLTVDFPLIEGGVLDSISIFQLATFLSDHYRVAIDDADLTYQNLRSLAAIAAMVETKLGQAATTTHQGSLVNGI